jgi:hypothetical protein
MKIRLVSALLLTFVLGCPGFALASEGTIAIVKFFDAQETVRLGLQSKIDEASKASPASAEMYRKAFARYSNDEILRRLGNAFDLYLSPEEVASFHAFIATPTGQKLAAIFKEHKNPQALGRAMSGLEPEHITIAEAFFKTPAMTNSLAAIKSEEAKKSAIEYGEDLACMEFKVSNPEALKKMRSAGKCMDNAK